MANEKTTVSLGFKSDLTELNRAGEKANWLKDRFDQLAHSVKKVSEAGVGLTQLSHTPGSGPAQPVGDLRTPKTGNGNDPAYDSKGKSNKRVDRGFGYYGKTGLSKLKGAGVGGLFAAGGALGLALTAASAVSKGISLAKAYMDALSPLNKQLSLLNGNQASFESKIASTAISLGIARAELLQYTKAYVGQAGAQKGRVGGQVKDIGGFAKGMGMDYGSTYAQMGGLAQAGAFGSLGGMRAKQFAALIADAVSRGNMNGREGELLSSINSLVSVQLQTLTRPGGMSGMINFMTGMNATGQAGLMGARGASVLSQISQGIKNPGGGDYGEMFMYNALGGGNFYDYKMRQEEGAFGANNNFLRVMGNMRKSFPNAKARWFAMSKLFPGLSMHQASGLESALGKVGSGGSGFMDALDSASSGNIEKINTENYGILAKIYNAKNGKERMEILKDSRLGGLSGNFTINSTREEVMKAVAGKNLVQTPEDAIKSELATINQWLESKGVEGIKAFSGAYDGINKIYRLLHKQWGSLTPEENARLQSELSNKGEVSTINPNNIVPYKTNVTADGKQIQINESQYNEADVQAFFKEVSSNLNQSSINLNQAADKIIGSKAVTQSGNGNTTRGQY